MAIVHATTRRRLRRQCKMAFPMTPAAASRSEEAEAVATIDRLAAAAAAVHAAAHHAEDLAARPALMTDRRRATKRTARVRLRRPRRRLLPTVRFFWVLVVCALLHACRFGRPRHCYAVGHRLPMVPSDKKASALSSTAVRHGEDAPAATANGSAAIVEGGGKRGGGGGGGGARPIRNKKTKSERGTYTLMTAVLAAQMPLAFPN